MTTKATNVSEGLTAEDVLREIASYVGAGGYNAEEVDPAVFSDKIRWGIDHLTETLEKDARRYRRLRTIGAAPGGSLHLEHGHLLVATNLDQWVDDYLDRGIQPAPSDAVEYGERYSATLSPPLPSPEVERLREMLQAAEDAVMQEQMASGHELVTLPKLHIRVAARRAIEAALSTSLPSLQPYGRVEIRKGDPDYERFNLTLSDEARERLAQKPSAAPIDCVIGGPSPLGVERLRKTVSVMADALTLADNIISGSCGTDTPREWPRALAKVTRARAALSALPLLEDRHEGGR